MRGSGKSFWSPRRNRRPPRAGRLILLSAEQGCFVGRSASLASFQQEDAGKRHERLIRSRSGPQSFFSSYWGDAPQQFMAPRIGGGPRPVMTDHPDVVDECWHQADTKGTARAVPSCCSMPWIGRRMITDDEPAGPWFAAGRSGYAGFPRRIRLKVFARPDHWKTPSWRIFLTHRRCSIRRSSPVRPRRELYGLLAIPANEPEHGEPFRSGVQAMPPNIQWKQEDGIWPVPAGLRRSEEMRCKSVFHAFTGPWMGKGQEASLTHGFPAISAMRVAKSARAVFFGFATCCAG